MPRDGRGIECWHFFVDPHAVSEQLGDYEMKKEAIHHSMIVAVFSAMAMITVAPSTAAILSDVIFRIDAEGPTGSTSTFEVFLGGQNLLPPPLIWRLPEPVPLLDAQGMQVAMLENASVIYDGDPVVGLNFVVSSAGGGTFTVTSANLSFDSLDNAVGAASAAVTVTDSAGDGASISGNFPNGDTYRAYYNDVDLVPAAGTTFATLTPGTAAAAFSSNASSEDFPHGASTFSSTDESGSAIAPLGSMSSQWRFGISPGDSVSGTSTFVVIPEPGSCLLCLCGIAVFGSIRHRVGADFRESDSFSNIRFVDSP